MDVSHVKKATILRGMRGVVCTDHSDQEPRRQVHRSKVIASGSLGSVISTMLARGWQEVFVQIQFRAQYFPFLSRILHYYYISHLCKGVRLDLMNR